MNIDISGGWSYGNIGDEAIAESTICMVEKLWCDEKIIYTSYNVEDFLVQHGKKSIYSLHKYLEDASIDDLDEARKYLNAGGGNESINNIDDNTLVILSGGGYVCRDWKSQIISQILLIEIAKKRNAKIISICQSIGPICNKELENQFANVMNQLDYISVRDFQSAGYLKRIGVSKPVDIVPDLAVIISDFIPNFEKKNNAISIMPACYTKYQGINVERNDSFLFLIIGKVINRLRFYKYRFFWIELLKKLKGEEIEFVMSTKWDADKRFLDYIIKKSGIKKYRIRNDMSIHEMLLTLAKNKITISSKMHPLIISSSYDVPTIGISYNFKTNYYMESINRKNYCFNNFALNSKDIIYLLDCEDMKSTDREVMNSRKMQVYEMFDRINEKIFA